MTTGTSDKTSVTIVIPAFNEQSNIAYITRQVLDEPWGDGFALDEVIIVDDCSEDRTQEITADLARADGRVRVIRHAQRGGKNAGMRTGLSASRSPIVVFLDADVRLGAQCVTKMVALLRDNSSLTAASCILEPLSARSWHERASRFQLLLVAELGRLGHGSLARVYSLRTVATSGLALPDTVYDDIYILRWLRNYGYRYALQTDATAYVRAAHGLRDFAKQTIRTWRAAEALDRLLPDKTPPAERRGRGVVARALGRAIAREPMGFVLYTAWRGIVTVTPTKMWLPVIDHSRYDTSISTKEVGV